jgi:hypothetical protein
MTRLQDLHHPSAGTTLMSEWLTGTAERSRTAADALLHEWAAAQAPAGRLAQHVFLSLDGTGLFFYAQWTSDEEHLAWARARRTEVVSRVDALVPGIERPGLIRTRLARSVVHDARRPGGGGTRRPVGGGAGVTWRPRPLRRRACSRHISM